MKNVLDFIVEHWGTISVLVGALALRLIPTEKNYDIFKKIWAVLDFLIPNLKKGGGKHKLKVITFFVCLCSYGASYAQLNVTARQLRFRTGVQNPVDTVESSGNEGNIWYDFVTGKYRANQGGINEFLIGGDGGGDFWKIRGTTELTSNVWVNSSNDVRFLVNSLSIKNPADTTFSITFPAFSGGFSTTYNNGANTYLSLTDQGLDFSGTMLTESYIKLATDANLNIQENGVNTIRYLGASNQLLIPNQANNATTSVYGGEIQLDVPGLGDDVTFTTNGINSSGLATRYFLTSSSGLDFQATDGTDILVSRSSGVSNNILIGENVGDGDSTAISGRIAILPWGVHSSLFAGVTTVVINGSVNVAAETDCNNCHYKKLISSVDVDGTFTVTPTAGNVLTVLAADPPYVEGNFSSPDDLVGTFTAWDATTDEFLPGSISALGTGVNTTLLFRFTPTTTNLYTISFHFQYEWEN